MANADWGRAQGFSAQAGQGNFQGNQPGQYGTQPDYRHSAAPTQHPAGGHYAQAPQGQQGGRSEPPMHARPQAHAPQHHAPQGYAPQPSVGAPQGYHHAPQYHAQPQAGYGGYQQPAQPQAHAAPQQGYNQASYYAQAAAPIPVEVDGEPGRFGRAMNIFGAVVSVTLIGGLAVWGYKLAMRDVTEIPVVAALEGPMRVQPENPGGVAADHQGLAVNNVAAVGVAEGPAPQVTLAPAPDMLVADDDPVVAEAEINAVPSAEQADAGAAVEDEAVAEVMPAAATTEDTRAAAQALIDQITADVAPLSDDEADLTMTDAAMDATAASADQIVRISADVPGIARSLRPMARPAGLVTRAAAAPAADPLLAATQSATSEVAAADIPVGTRLVQLGAYDSEDVARAEWDALAGKFDEFMGDKTRVIEMAQSGGKTFYRLRAMGFDDLSDARRFCSALMAGQAACIPVVTR